MPGSTNDDGVYVYDGTDVAPGTNFKNLLNLASTALTALLGWRGRTFHGTTAARDAFSTAGLAKTADKWHSTTDSITYRYSGAAWDVWEHGTIPFTPTLTNMTLGNGSRAGSYTRVGKLIVARMEFQMGSTSAMGTNPKFSLPVPAAVGVPIALSVILTEAGVADLPGTAYMSTTEVTPHAIGTAAAYAGFAVITAAVPFGWGTNDVLRVGVVYEAAA